MLAKSAPALASALLVVELPGLGRTLRGHSTFHSASGWWGSGERFCQAGVAKHFGFPDLLHLLLRLHHPPLPEQCAQTSGLAQLGLTCRR